MRTDFTRVVSALAIAVLAVSNSAGSARAAAPTPVATPAATPASSPGLGLGLDDAMPDFFATWDADASKPLAERVTAFRTKVIARHPGLFVRVGSLTDDDIGAFLQNVAPDIDAMRALSASIVARVDTEVRRFRTRFPDFVPDATLAMLPSLYHFNGQIRFSPRGTFTIALGIDTLAREKASDAQLALEIDHELFHVYHGQRQLALASDHFESGVPIWFETWAEGLAAYASAEMNPSLGEREALGEKLASATPAVQRALACFVEVHLEGIDPRDSLELFTGGASPPNFPDRGAYLVGYLTAQHLAKSSSLSELAALHDAGARSAVAREVHAQCGS